MTILNNWTTYIIGAVYLVIIVSFLFCIIKHFNRPEKDEEIFPEEEE